MFSYAWLSVMTFCECVVRCLCMQVPCRGGLCLVKCRLSVVTLLSVLYVGCVRLLCVLAVRCCEELLCLVCACECGICGANCIVMGVYCSCEWLWCGVLCFVNYLMIVDKDERVAVG